MLEAKGIEKKGVSDVKEGAEGIEQPKWKMREKLTLKNQEPCCIQLISGLRRKSDKQHISQYPKIIIKYHGVFLTKQVKDVYD